MEKQAGQQGLAIVFNSALFVQQTDDKLNQLVVTRLSDGNVADYWAGFCWDKAGHIADQAGWNKYVDEFAQGLASPIEVNVSAK